MRRKINCLREELAGPLALSDLHEERSVVESFQFDIFTEVHSAQNETRLPSLYVRLE